jgi:hypothetical protein
MRPKGKLYQIVDNIFFEIRRRLWVFCFETRNVFAGLLYLKVIINRVH